MNAFREHHEHSIRASYRCFDRILLNGLLQPFQQPERVIGFFSFYRNQFPVSRKVLTDIADQFQYWVKNRSERWAAPILEAPEGRRDEFVAPYFRKAKPDQVVAILKAREPARIMTAIGSAKENRWHLQIAQRWVIQYNFYVKDARWGRMFVRMCPYFPFSARVCLNQHHWLANRLREEGISFEKTSNAFLKCGNFARLQELADSLTAKDLLSCGQKWLNAFTPFFTARERKDAGLPPSAVFRAGRVLRQSDLSPAGGAGCIGRTSARCQPHHRPARQDYRHLRRKITAHHRGKLPTEIEDMQLPNPVVRSHYGNGFIKQYVRDHRILRTETATNNVNDYEVNKAVENLPKLREKLSVINDNYQNVQQDILETFVDRGQLRKLAEPTVLPGGKRIPGLKLDHPRQLGLMHALVRFAHVAASSTFTTGELYPEVLDALGCSASKYSLASLRYDLSKLRAKGLVEKLPHSRRYRLLPCGYLPQALRAHLRSAYRRTASSRCR